MNKLSNLKLFGLCVFLAGITMLMAENIGVKYAKIMIPILFAIGGIFSLLYSSANKHIKVASQFQMLKGVGLIVFAGVIAFLPKSLSNFLMYVTYFMLVFGILEIMISFTVLTSNIPIVKEILILRMAGGFIIAIGAVVLLLITFSDENQGLMIAGILTALIGLSNIIFASKVKNITVPE